MEFAKAASIAPGKLRFDGRTAIVTGAGGNPSLGQAHAPAVGRTRGQCCRE